MFVYTMAIYAANPNKPFIFTEKQKEILNETAAMCNNSINFKGKGKTIEIIEFQKNCLIIKLESKAPLQKPTLTLRGFSRALIKTGEFAEYTYRSSLFNAREIELKEHEKIDDIGVVKKVVELFMSQSGDNDVAKEKIRQIITEL